MKPITIDVSAIIATKDRLFPLQRTVKGLLEQSHIPAELIIVDASGNYDSEKYCKDIVQDGHLSVKFLRAKEKGATKQRLQGVGVATQPIIWFLDDDIIFENECVGRI